MMPGRSMERLSSNDLSRPKDYFLKIAPARLKEKPPKSLAHDVIDAGAYGLVAGRLENLRLRCVRNEGFLRGPESRAHQHAIGAEASATPPARGHRRCRPRPAPERQAPEQRGRPPPPASPPKRFGGQLQGKIKLLMPVCFRAPQLLWCAAISDGQLAIAARSPAGLR